MSLIDLNGVGESRLALLNKLNIYSIGDLLSHFPKKYEDRQRCRPLKDLLEDNDEQYPVEVKVLGYDYFYANKKKVLKVVVTDGFLRASLICFNRDFMKNVLEEGKEYVLFGDFQYRYGEVQATRFEFVPKGSAGESLNFMRIVPIYPLTEGITQNFMRQIVFEALTSTRFGESLPDSIIEKRQLMSKKESFREIHFPKDHKTLEKAIYRLKYYELFELECNVALKKHYFTHHKKRRYQDKPDGLVSQMIQSLPFELTSGQINALKEVKDDLLSQDTMYRMIQGDVGCGKTVVAILAMLTVVENAYQTALMVPTEVLAKQHYQTLSGWLNPLSIRVELLTGGVKTSKRREILKDIKDGSVQIIVGTHALFSEDVEYHDLGLIVIDEQHKFGVQERIQLVEKGEAVDILIMTATPIPRSLSLTVYGDLELTVIREKPRRSIEIYSHIVSSDEKRKTMYEYMDKEIEKGRQGFVVCPLIEESEKIDLSSTISVFEAIKSQLPNRKTALLHGRHSPDEKEDIMAAYLNGEYDILISTTVIEVGVDVSNASFMVVENADRFGLSQLHQLRGRIGRGNYHSHCFFCIDHNLSEDGKSRLKALMSHNDGFALAEEDLKIRGPGEFLGNRQSGLDTLKLANLITDESILLKAKEDAFQILRVDPQFELPENQILAKTIYKRFVDQHRLYLTS